MAAERPNGTQAITVVAAEPVADAVAGYCARDGSTQRRPKFECPESDARPGCDHHRGARQDQPHYGQRLARSDEKNARLCPVGMLGNPVQKGLDVDVVPSLSMPACHSLGSRADSPALERDDCQRQGAKERACMERE